MLIYFRVDASLQIGTGHVMRCLSLAAQLRKSGDAVRFLCRDTEGNLLDYINAKGFPAYALANPTGARGGSDGSGGFPSADLPSRADLPPHAGSLSHADSPPHAHWLPVPWSDDAAQTIERLKREAARPDWLIVDHYALDWRYESAVRPYVGQIMAIDDLADRRHECDLLLDQSYDESYDKERNSRYKSLAPASCKLFLGPDYALLREEFRAARPAVKARDGSIRKVLLSFGGVDLTGETIKAIEALIPFMRQGVQVKAVLGKMNRNASFISDFGKRLPNCVCYEHVEHMTELMADADLAVGSGGTTTWERCCLGLPGLVIATARNQEKLSQRLAQTGAIEYLGKASDVTSFMIRNKVAWLMDNKPETARMADRAAALVDGRGCERISGELRK